MNLSPKTILFQVHQSGLVLKHRDKITCHGEICICFGSAPLLEYYSYFWVLYSLYFQMHIPNTIYCYKTNFVA